MPEALIVIEINGRVFAIVRDQVLMAWASRLRD